MIAPNVRHFAFRTQEEFNFIPGQFVTMHFEVDGKMLRRSYSIASIQGQSQLLEFAAGYVENGPASKLLFALQPGETININGPFGRLVLKDEQPKRYFLVATSTGVTPYRAMLPLIKDRLSKENVEFHVLQGVQHRQDVLYADEFIAFAKENPNFHFRAHLSRESDKNLHSHEYAGYVQKSLEALEPCKDSDIVYLCGNPSMVDESFALLTDRGFDIKSIRREKYISSK